MPQTSLSGTWPSASSEKSAPTLLSRPRPSGQFRMVSFVLMLFIQMFILNKMKIQHHAAPISQECVYMYFANTTVYTYILNPPTWESASYLLPISSTTIGGEQSASQPVRSSAGQPVRSSAGQPVSQ